MERLHFKLEFADNGIVIKNTDIGSVDVYQKKEACGGSDYREYTERGIKESIGDYIAGLIIDGSENLKQKDSFKINIAIF